MIELKPGCIIPMRTMIAAIILGSLDLDSVAAQTSARIYISTDRGHTWKPSSAGFPAEATVNDFGVLRGVVYAGTEAHGMFVSRDGGRTWAAANEGLASDEKIGAVEAAEDLVFAGTARSGIFISKDDGKTWSAAGAGLPNTNVRTIASMGRTVLAGTNDGVFASSDNGRRWFRLTRGIQINGLTVLGQQIFAATVAGVIRSDDNGRTWKNVGRFGAVHNVSNDGRSLFVMSYNAEVWRTNDGGATWKRADAGLPSLYTFQILALDGILLAGQWPGLFMSRNESDRWTMVRAGLPPQLPIKELERIGKDRVLAGAGQVR